MHMDANKYINKQTNKISGTFTGWLKVFADILIVFRVQAVFSDADNCQEYVVPVTVNICGAMIRRMILTGENWGTPQEACHNGTSLTIHLKIAWAWTRASMVLVSFRLAALALGVLQFWRHVDNYKQDRQRTHNIEAHPRDHCSHWKAASITLKVCL
jgi:hypothetical protein